jgi:hypothetical protein
MGSGISEATQSFKDLFGKKDASATNDVLNGDVVATGTPGAKTVADPKRRPERFPDCGNRKTGCTRDWRSHIGTSASHRSQKSGAQIDAASSPVVT